MYESSSELEFPSAEGDNVENRASEVDSDEEFEAQVYLSSDEAARCLCMLGKNDSGLKYSYLMLQASDKNLTDISVIPTFRNILFVDVSGNRLTPSAMRVLRSMTYLLMLRADRNRIFSPEMEPMLYLQVLTLNRNGIVETSGISHRLLECLELNENRITDVNLDPYILENLRVLELRGNLLRTTNGIFFPSLVALYLANNRIENVEGLETLVNLKILHVRGNQISRLDGFPRSCIKLSYLNLRDNKIASFDEVRKLRELPGLETLVVSQNPLALGDDEDEDRGYRVKLIAALPDLIRIDKDPVQDLERDEARELGQWIAENGESLDKMDGEIRD